jgi:hypothetical protein
MAALAERYRVERELGAGGIATVYLAEDRRPGIPASRTLRDGRTARRGDGAIVYVQGPDERGSPSLRIIPNWVAQMKAAVDGAGS